MIRKCGILKSQDLVLIDDAYRLYRQRIPNRETRRKTYKKFINDNSFPNPQIKFLGVWDTVGALGIPHTAFRMMNKRRYRFHDLTLTSIVKHAYQAMAIDERRSLFEVNIWKRSTHAIKHDVEQFVEQRWFAGVHSEVGGGYRDEQLSDLSLLWIIDRAREAGLGIDLNLAVKTKDFPVFLSPDPAAKPHNNITLIHRFNPIITRTIGQEKGLNECIDASVLERMRLVKGYDPKNVKDAIAQGIAVQETVAWQPENQS